MQTANSEPPSLTVDAQTMDSIRAKKTEIFESALYEGICMWLCGFYRR